MSEALFGFYYFGFLHRLKWGQSWAKTEKKSANFGNVQFPQKFLFSKNIWNTVFLSLNTTSGANFSNIRQYLGQLRSKKHSKKSHFMDAVSSRKHGKLYHLTTANAIKMKLTTIAYLHENFHLAKDWGVTHTA